ncbi:permease [Halobacteriales archaeon QS_8_69_26]|nr:MAG: permease [Halobacteriales archaeon QS_8_69_26]
MFELYREFIGEPDANRDVYLGFGVFFGGIALLGIALALFLVAGTNPARSPAYFAWAGPAYALGMIAVPATLVGVVVLLPVEDRALYGSLGGAAVTTLAVAWFWTAYPQDWNGYGADLTVPVVAVYAVGLTAVVGATGAALVAHRIQQARPPSIEEVEAKRENGDDTEEWSDERIERDIEEAMEETEISWGGVEESENRTLDLEMDVEVSGVDVEADTTRSSGVDDQVAGLRQLKTGEADRTTASESTVDDQTAALTELKRQKREGETPDAPGEDDGGIVDRLRGMLG